MVYSSLVAIVDVAREDISRGYGEERSRGPNRSESAGARGRESEDDGDGAEKKTGRPKR